MIDETLNKILYKRPHKLYAMWVTLLDWTPIFGWYMAKLMVESGSTLKR